MLRRERVPEGELSLGLSDWTRREEGGCWGGGQWGLPVVPWPVVRDERSGTQGQETSLPGARPGCPSRGPWGSQGGAASSLQSSQLLGLRSLFLAPLQTPRCWGTTGPSLQVSCWFLG